MTDSQRVTWTALAILAMFLFIFAFLHRYAPAQYLWQCGTPAVWPCDISCVLLLLFPAEISLKAAYCFGLVWGKEVSAIFSIVMTAQEDSTILLGLLSERAASGRGLRAVTTSWVAPRPRSFKAIHNLQIGSKPNIQTNSWVDLGLCNSIYQHISVLIPILE